ncbi:MAG: beta-propeller fold lactonase family protein [Leptospirillia bacterium]
MLHKGQQGKKMAGRKASTKAVVALGVAAGLMVGVAAQAHAASVTTIAGEFHERGAVDGTGSQARFEYVQGIVAAPDGTLYLADTGNDMIRKVTVSGGSATVTTIAGVNHHARFRDGNGTAARFNNPEGLAISSDGKTLYIADSRNNRVRKMDLGTGAVSTLAGRPFPGSNDGVGTSAGLYGPRALALTPDGKTLYISDSGNNMIRKLDLTTGAVTTVAGKGALTAGLDDGIGVAASFRDPRGIALSSDGTVLYVADTRNNLIRKIVLATNAVSTLAGHPGFPGVEDGAGSSAFFNQPVALTVNGNTLYVGDSSNASIRAIDLSSNNVTTVAGGVKSIGLPISGKDDGDVSVALFQYTGAIAYSNGVIYIADIPAETLRMLKL